MKRKRFSEEQIIGVLPEHEAGAKTGDLARRHVAITRQFVALSGLAVALVRYAIVVGTTS